MKTPAVVTYMHYSGLGIVRSLGRRGVPVFALDPDPWQLGMRSRFCTWGACPALEDDEERYVQYLVRLARSSGEKLVLYATGDNTVLCHAKHEDVLKEHFLFTGPPADLVRRTVTKQALFATAREHGIPVPETWAPASLAEVDALSARISYPCLIKPARASSWHRPLVQRRLQEIQGGSEKVIVARDRDALLAAYRQISEVDPDLTLSEIIPGSDDQLVYFAFYRYADGTLCRFSGRKLRTTPPHFGSASFVTSIVDADLDALSADFLRKLDYRGLGGLEFKRDLRDGRYKLIELNARFGLWDALGQRCGADTAWAAYRDVLGLPREPSGARRTGVKWASAFREARALLEYRREGQVALPSWLRSLRGEKQWAVFSWDDPLPALVGAVRFWRKVAAKLSREGRALLTRAASPRVAAPANRAPHPPQNAVATSSEPLPPAANG